MDVPRPATEMRRRRLRRRAVGVAAMVAAGAGALGISWLGAAAPSVARDTLWIDTVREGELTREVHGAGELVPDDDAARWAAAEVDGRVERKLLEAGAVVKADTVLLQLSNPDVEQAAVAANLALDGAVAAYANLEAALQNELLTLRSAAAAVAAERDQAALQAEVDTTLERDGVLPSVTARQSRLRAGALETRVSLEEARVTTTERSLVTRLAAQRSELESRRTVAALKRRDLDAMTVRAGIDGVLQEVVVDVGQRVTRSANLARVIDPARLKARLRIPEAQTDDLHVGLPVRVDTHNGVVPGQVTRIAPSAQNGTVVVDVALRGGLPRGSRVDMTVDGTIELERLAAVRYVGRPASGQTEGEIALFRLSPDGARAERVMVRVGPASANNVRLLDRTLQPGDRVVLSDTSTWGASPVVRLR